MSLVKSIVRWLAPSGFITLLKSVRKHNVQHMWSGNYAKWEQAMSHCTGYDHDLILQKCKDALLKIKNGTAVYERDSVIFDKKQYSWPLLSALQNAAIQNEHLNVLDFGGSLGSTYYQNKGFLSAVKTIKWGIVEQGKFVQCGKEIFEDEELKFYYSIEQCIDSQSPDVLLLSGVLQCLDDPYNWVEKMVGLGIPTIIIDRTAFIDKAPPRITVQNVPADIYEASYPCWFFNEEKLLTAFTGNYDLVADFDSFADSSTISDDGKRLYWKGFILKIKK